MRWTMALLVALCMSLTAGATFAQANDQGRSINEIETFKVNEEADGTVIRIAGDKVPTFSVFKLNEPPRLFIDVSNSELAGDTKTERINNGVISQVALIEFKDNIQSVTRVIIGFDNPAHYDVKTEGNDVVVFVDGSGRTQGSNAVARMNVELQQQQDKIKKLESTYQTQLAQKEAAVQRSQSELKSREKELARLQAELKRTSGSDAKRVSAQIETKNQEITALRTDVVSGKKAVQSLQSRVARLESERDQLSKVAESTKAERDRALALAAAKEKEGEKVRQRAEKLEKSLAKTQLELESINNRSQKVQSDLQRANANAKRSQEAYSQAQRDLEQARKREAELKAAVARLERSASSGDSAAKSKLASLQREAETVSADRQKRQAELAQAKRAAKSAQTDLQETRRELAQRDAQLQELQTRLAQVEAERQTLSRQANSANDDRVKALERALSEEQARVASLESKRDASSSRLVEVQAELRAARKELAVTKSARVGRAVPVNPNSNTVRGIKLENNGERSRIVVELERPGNFETLPWKDSRAVMILNGVELPENLERTLANQGQAGAVRFVSSYRDNQGRVRLEAELGSDATEVVRQDGNKLVWEFASVTPVAAMNDAPDEQTRPTADSHTAAPPRYPVIVTDPTRVSRVPGMSRKRITIDLRAADIQNVLRLLAKEGGVNIVAGDVSGNVTLRLRSVPLDEVFLTILQARQLGFEKRGNVIRVAPQSVLLQEQQARAQARAAAAVSKPLEVFLLPVNYASASDMQAQVAGLLSPRGSVTVDPRTNTLIIKDIAENLSSVRALVNSLDSQVPQVLIEARIVETNDTFTRSLGIQWGGDVSWSQANGNPTGLVFPGVLGLTGGATDAQAPVAGVSSNPNYAVNLPSAVGTGSGGALGLTMGSVGGAVNLNLRLSALETAGQVKIVSSPKILTLDNQTATISQGTSIPISVVSAAGVQTVFVEATLELEVTPHVTPDGNIQLSVNATKNEPDFQNTGARGDPTIIQKQAETELLIKDGDTTVIGGIYTRNAGTSISAVPFFHRIPILGFFFRTESEREQRTELLIFITPKIVNRAESLGGRE